MHGWKVTFAAIALSMFVSGCRKESPSPAASRAQGELDLRSQTKEIQQAAACARDIMEKEHLLRSAPVLSKVVTTAEHEWTVRFEATRGEQGMVDVSVSIAPCKAGRVLVYQ